MYGYNHEAEYQRLKIASLQGAYLLEHEIRPRIDKNDTSALPFDSREILRLMTIIYRIRSLVTNDGNWLQRPFDLLSRSHIDQEGQPSEYAKDALQGTRFQLALDRCKEWEETQMLFFFENAFWQSVTEDCKKGKKTKQKKQMEESGQLLNTLSEEKVARFATKPWWDLCSNIKKIENKQEKDRLSYDVFDNEISYTERIARWQEDTVWALPGLQSDTIIQNMICIPDALYVDIINKYLQSGKQVEPFISLSLFCAMLYRHLKGMGVTANDLKRKQENNLAIEYWSIPSKSAFGSYQNFVLSDSFFSQVEKLVVIFDNPPIRLLSINDRWMAWMDPELFRAFESSEYAEKECQLTSPFSDMPNVDRLTVQPVNEEDEYRYWLNAYQDAHKLLLSNMPIDERKASIGGNPNETRNYLVAYDNGGYETYNTISRHIRSLYVSNKKTPASYVDWHLLFKKEGSQLPSVQLWKAAEQEKRVEWLRQATDTLKNQSEIISLNDGSSKQFDLRLIKNNSSKNGLMNTGFRAAALMVGLYCAANANKPVVSLDYCQEEMIEYCKIDETTFSKYCSDIASDLCCLIIYRETDMLKAALINLMDKEHDLIKMVQAHSIDRDSKYSYEDFNALYTKALAISKPANLLNGKCGTEYLPQWKKQNDLANLQAFAQRVLFWSAIRASEVSADFYEQSKLWNSREDLNDFLNVNRLLDEGWIKLWVEMDKRVPGKIIIREGKTRFNETEEHLKDALLGGKKFPEFSTQMCEAWQHLIHLGMLVLWNYGFSNKTGRREESIVFKYSKPLSGTDSKDNMALCFAMFAMDFFKVMRPEGKLICNFENGIWKIDKEQLLINENTWDGFWENTENLRLQRKKQDVSYIFHNIVPKRDSFIFSISETRKNKKSICR